MAQHPSRLECTRVRMHRTNWHQMVVPEIPGTASEISKLHCQPYRQPLIETWPGVGDGTKDKNRKTEKHMGLASAILLPMEMRGRMEHNSNAYRSMVWLTHMDSFDAGGVRLEVGLVVVVSRGAKRCLAQIYATPIHQACQPHQFALSTRVGTETVVHAVRIFYTQPSAYIGHDSTGETHTIIQANGGEQSDSLFFCRRISVLDCCTGQSPGKGNEMTVVLVSLQATK